MIRNWGENGGRSQKIEGTRPMLLLVLGRNAAAASEDNEKSTLTDFQKWHGCEKNVFMYECFYTAMHARLEVKN
jgi:hypothetical protein